MQDNSSIYPVFNDKPELFNMAGRYLKRNESRREDRSQQAEQK